LKNKKGTLYLIPVPLGAEGYAALSQQILDVLPRLKHFIVERERTARRFVKQVLPDADIGALTFFELDKHHPEILPDSFVRPLLEGCDMGLLSEAGCPGIADPGAVVVRKVHELGGAVKPLSGPSAIVLALMASGLNGQQFVFHGYLPVKKGERIRKLRELERAISQTGRTQIFIETPYRNAQLFEALLHHLPRDLSLCVAMDLSLPTEFVATKKVALWRSHPLAFEDKRPAVFLIGR